MSRWKKRGIEERKEVCEKCGLIKVIIVIITTEHTTTVATSY